MKLELIAPIGTREARGFVSRTNGRGGYEVWTEREYPPSPEGDELRRVRVHELGMGIRDAAMALDLRPAEVSDLEFGRARPVDGWPALFAALREKAKGRP